MRDPNRAGELLNLINEIWLFDPDMRFNQLIYLLQNGYSNKNKGRGRVENIESDGFTTTGFDFFNVEDENFIEYLKQVKIDRKF